MDDDKDAPPAKEPAPLEILQAVRREVAADNTVLLFDVVRSHGHLAARVFRLCSIADGRSLFRELAAAAASYADSSESLAQMENGVRLASVQNFYHLPYSIIDLKDLVDGIGPDEAAAKSNLCRTLRAVIAGDNVGGVAMSTGARKQAAYNMLVTSAVAVMQAPRTRMLRPETRGLIWNVIDKCREMGEAAGMELPDSLQEQLATLRAGSGSGFAPGLQPVFG